MSAATGRPNVMMIVLDQLRYDCLGHTSGGRVRTPNLDALAARGTTFTQAYSHLPICGPARQSLLTSQRPETLGTLWNYDSGPRIPALDPGTPTWSSALSHAGYATAYFGAWHVSPDHGPGDFGYDQYLSYDGYRRFLQDQHPDLEIAGGRLGAALPIPAKDGAPAWFAREVTEQIGRLSGQRAPWHVRLDLFEPHLPCRPTAEYADRYPADQIEPWESFEEDFHNKPYIQRQQLINWGIDGWGWQQWAPVLARYFAVIEEVDAAIGQVLEAADRAGSREDTVVIITTDHGDMAGAHRMIDKHYVLYDDTTHVPLIMAGPGIQQGQRRDEFVYNLLDLGPTILQACGLPELDAAVGRSLRPLLSDDDLDPPWRDQVVLTFNGQQFGLYTQRAIRTTEWKYIWNATDVDELYSLADDPAELTNLALDDSTEDLRWRLGRRLYAELEAFGDRQVMNPWIRAQLTGE